MEFDVLLQAGRQAKAELPSHKETYLQGIAYTNHRLIRDLYSFRIYCSKPEEPGFRESDDYIIIRIGKCYPTFLLSERQKYYKELSLKDLEQIYSEIKLEIHEAVKGNYVLIFINKKSNTLKAFTGKSGLIKLYYAYKNGTLIVSTSMAMITRSSLNLGELNPIAIIEQLRFGYPLGDMTLAKDIRFLDGYTELEYDIGANLLKFNKINNYEGKLRSGQSLGWEETYQQTPVIFNRVMQTYLEGKKPINQALTSGFDSRATLSYSYAHKDRIQFFSYGASSEGDDVRIPAQLAQALGFKYKWIELGSEFLAKYDHYSNQLLYFTDGLGNIKRCNQMYSQSILADNSDTCITGCMGSELLRPNNMMNTYLLPDMVKLIYAEKLNTKALNQIMEHSPGLLRPDYYEKHKDEVIEHIRDNLQSVMIFREPHLNLYNFTLRYALRKFFGQEFHASRIYSHLLSPFMDDDFVGFILTTPVPGLNRHAFRRNASDLRKGQLFYLPIIKRNLPELMMYETGRGYKPYQLESTLFPLNIALPFTSRRIANKLRKNKIAFNASEWNKISYKKNPSVFTTKNEIFNSIPREQVRDSDYSLKKWALDYC